MDNSIASVFYWDSLMSRNDTPNINTEAFALTCLAYVCVIRMQMYYLARKGIT